MNRCFMERNIWLVSGGPLKRDYAAVFIRHGVALIGPGDIEAWSANRLLGARLVSMGGRRWIF